MKAEWNDAPDYVRRRPRKGAVAWLIPGLIGTVIMLAALHMVSSAFLKGTVQGIADKRVQPKPATAADVTRSTVVSAPLVRLLYIRLLILDINPNMLDIAPINSPPDEGIFV